MPLDMGYEPQDEFHEDVEIMFYASAIVPAEQLTEQFRNAAMESTQATMYEIVPSSVDWIENIGIYSEKPFIGLRVASSNSKLLVGLLKEAVDTITTDEIDS